MATRVFPAEPVSTHLRRLAIAVRGMPSTDIPPDHMVACLHCRQYADELDRAAETVEQMEASILDIRDQRDREKRIVWNLTHREFLE